MSHSSVAKSVRENKERHPENYCNVLGCLWRTETRDGFKPCPKHSRCTCENNGDYCRVCQSRLEAR